MIDKRSAAAGGGEPAGLHLTREEIAAAFEPFVKERCSTSEPSWAALLAAREAKIRAKGERAGPEDELPFPEHEDEGALAARAVAWLTKKFAVEPGDTAFQWHDQGFKAKGIATSRIHALAILRVIEQLAPESVCEIGCGSGINLFLAAGRHPQVRLAGIDVNGDAVARARAVQRLPGLPPIVETFSPEPLPDRTAYRRIDFRQGDARFLPFPDGSFDLVFTRLALERMQGFRDEALRELRRVARHHVVMIEGFREWNAGGLQRAYMMAHRYFDCALEELPRLGLEPLMVFDDLPYKINYRPVVVIARPRQ